MERTCLGCLDHNNACFSNAIHACPRDTHDCDHVRMDEVLRMPWSRPVDVSFVVVDGAWMTYH